jgi:hypothetical protein
MTHSWFYEFCRDQGSLVGGVLALVAGVLAYFGALKAANRQVTALRRRDHLQALGIVVAIYPELIEIEVALDRTTNILTHNFPAVAGGMKISILQVVRTAKIDLPPMIARNADNLFIVAPGGASLIQVVSYTCQYNGLVDTLIRQIDEDPSRFKPAEHQEHWSGRLKAIMMALTDASRAIGPLHDEATKTMG